MTKQNIFHTSLVSRSEGLSAARLDDETVLMGVHQGFYYGLDETGSRIWELISTPCPVFAIIEALLVEYNVEEERCRDEVLAFLDHLADEGLIKIENPER